MHDETQVLINPGIGLRISPHMRIYILADDFDTLITLGMAVSFERNSDELLNTNGSFDDAAILEGPYSQLSTPGTSDIAIKIPVDSYTTSLRPDSSTLGATVGLSTPMTRITVHVRLREKRMPSFEVAEAVKLLDYEKSCTYQIGQTPLSVLRNPNHIVICR